MAPSIKKNFIYNTSYQILTLITPLITAPYASRVLGDTGIGIQSYTNATEAYFALFAALGTASYGQREIARHRDNPEQRSKLFWEIELLSVLTTLLTTFIWIGVIISSEKYSLYYLILTINLIAVAFDITWFYGGQELFKFIVLRNSIIKLIGIVVLFLFVKNKDDLLLYMLLLGGTTLLGNISMWTYLPRLLVHVDFKTLVFKKHFIQTLSYFIPTIATSVYTVLDKSMIMWITNSESQNGYYEQSTKIIRMTEALVFSLNTVMGARLSYLFAEGKYKEIKDKIHKSFNYLIFVSVGIMFGLIGISRWFVPWFFGKAYYDVIPLLMLMAPLPLIICVSNILGCQYLTPSGQRVRSSKAIVAGAAVNFICNFVFINLWEARGAVIGSLIAEMVISFLYVQMSKDYVTYKAIFLMMWKRLIAGFVMLLVIWQLGCVFGVSIFTTLIQTVVGIVIYTIILTIMNDTVVIEIYSKISTRFGKKRGE